MTPKGRGSSKAEPYGNTLTTPCWCLVRTLAMSDLAPCLVCGKPCCKKDNPHIRLTGDIIAWGRIFPICRCPTHYPDPEYLPSDMEYLAEFYWECE